MEEMIWDTKTMTTSDFSVKVYLNDSVMKKWKKQSDESKSFKKFFEE